MYTQFHRVQPDISALTALCFCCAGDVMMNKKQIVSEKKNVEIE